MKRQFKRGDHVGWNSEGGRVRGVVMKRVVSDFNYKGYIHHATRNEPQYLIRSDKTDHVAIHKGAALHILKSVGKRSADSRRKKRRAHK